MVVDSSEILLNAAYCLHLQFSFAIGPQPPEHPQPCKADRDKAEDDKLLREIHPFYRRILQSRTRHFVSKRRYDLIEKLLDIVNLVGVCGVCQALVQIELRTESQ